MTKTKLLLNYFVCIVNIREQLNIEIENVVMKFIEDELKMRKKNFEAVVKLRDFGRVNEGKRKKNF